jgi:hypothetical protein
LQPLGSVGQIQPMQANLRHPWSVDRAIEGADARFEPRSQQQRWFGPA